MPRTRRIKPNDVGVYYHLMNRVAGEPGEYPFGDAEKEMLVRLLKEACCLFTVEPLGYQVMGSHWHVVCHAPAEVLAPEATAARYNRFYAGDKAPLLPEDPQCIRIAADLRDISCFMRWIQQRFTAWFNRTRPKRRRGTLWAGRFKSTVLERDTALWECLCYVEMNAARAGIVEDPATYRFGSWGEWCGSGKHPFAQNLLSCLLAYEGTEARSTTLTAIQSRFRVDFARRLAWEAGATTEGIEEAMGSAATPPRFTLRLGRRVRYWSDGLVIGQKIFVREMAARVFGTKQATKHRLAPADGRDICAYRRLHSLPT